MNINSEGYLKVSDLHSIYYYDIGNQEGTAVLYVHGGPGGGADLSASKYFDLNYYRVIIFDQRACGRSIPFASIVENTTFDLVADIEKLRMHLNIENWIVFGGSWGSTLSLVYAINHPIRVLALVLRGIFLGTKREFDFLYQRGANYLFPDKYANFVQKLSDEERKNVLQAFNYYLNLDDDKAKEYAIDWAQYELDLISLLPKNYDAKDEIDASLAISRIECHYFINNCFMEEDYILNNCDIIQDIPTYIVHGRYDVVCPLENAYLLNQKLPNSELYISADAGHSASEPSTFEYLVKTMENLKR